MEQVKRNSNCIEYFETKQERDKKMLEQDKDFIIADLMMQNAELQQQINDMSLIVADLMIGGAK